MGVVQALEAKATSHMIQALLDTEAGQLGLVQGLQQALAERPKLRDALNKVLNNGSAQH